MLKDGWAISIFTISRSQSAITQAGKSFSRDLVPGSGLSCKKNLRFDFKNFKATEADISFRHFSVGFLFDPQADPSKMRGARVELKTGFPGENVDKTYIGKRGKILSHKQDIQHNRLLDHYTYLGQFWFWY